MGKFDLSLYVLPAAYINSDVIYYVTYIIVYYIIYIFMVVSRVVMLTVFVRVVG